MAIHWRLVSVESRGNWMENEKEWRPGNGKRMRNGKEWRRGMEMVEIEKALIGE